MPNPDQSQRATTFEFAGKTIGVVIEDAHGFSFTSSTTGFHALEGLNFAGLRQLEKAAQALVGSDTSRRRSEAIQRWRRPAALHASTPSHA